MEKQRSREEFRTLLEHWGEEGDLDPSISFQQIASVCRKMPFWACLEVEELEDIFQDYIGAYESTHKNAIKERHYERKRELFRILEDRWGASPVLPSWKDAQVIFDQHRTTTAALDDLDRFEVFEDFIIEKVEKMKEERRKRERREGRKKRDAFISLLESYKDRIVPIDGEAMRWDDIQPLIRDERSYVDLIGTRNSSQPYDLFSEFRSTWKRERESRKRQPSDDLADLPDTKRQK